MIKNKVEIVGNGMIANNMKRCQLEVKPALLFASGVADSTCQDQKQYDREHDLLKDIIKYCKKSEQILVYFSSAGAVYGNCNVTKDESSSSNPTNYYGFNKIVSENLIIESRINYLILRASNLVGRQQNAKQLIPYLTESVIKGEVILYSDATRDLLDVEDLAKWTYLLINSINKSEIVNMASGISIAIIDILNEILSILQTDARIKLISGGNKHSFSIDKLENYIKFKPDQDYWKIILKKYLPAKEEDILMF